MATTTKLFVLRWKIVQDCGKREQTTESSNNPILMDSLKGHIEMLPSICKYTYFYHFNVDSKSKHLV